MDGKRKFQIGVFGSGEGFRELWAKCAQEMGSYIAKFGCVLITGACGGLPHEAAYGAAANGGLVVGISPAANLQEHIGKYRFPVDPFYTLIFTGAGKKGRNVTSLRSCDAAIFIAGRIGTLNEFTIAYDEMPEGSVIGILKGSGGMADRLAGLAGESGKPSKAIIIENEDPYLLVTKILDSLELKRILDEKYPDKKESGQ